MPIRRPTVRTVSVVPMWRQVYDHFAAAAESGELRPGEKLPGFRGLGEEWGIGYTTMQHALAELKAAGILVAAPGKGIFVAGEAEGEGEDPESP